MWNAILPGTEVKMSSILSAVINIYTNVPADDVFQF
jgi:hypothetical protein